MCVAAASVLLVAGCSTGGKPTPTVGAASSPPGVDLPPGVTITAAGSTLEVGQPGSVVYRVGDRAASAITVTVDEVATGNIKKDFTFFSLDDAAKASTAHYVRLTVRNEGPSGLGGVTIPILAHTASNTVFPPSEFVGTFPPCPNPTLPKSFLAGSEADLCLVFMLPKGENLRTIDLQTGSEVDALHWTP